MVDFKDKPKKFQRLKHKYRLVILNDDTFEEKVSLRLSQLNVFVVLGISSLVLILLVILLIAFTPLKEFIPGYANVNVRKQGVENFLKSVGASFKGLYSAGFFSTSLFSKGFSFKKFFLLI